MREIRKDFVGSVSNWKGLRDVLEHFREAAETDSFRTGLIYETLRLVSEAETVTFDSVDELLLYPPLRKVIRYDIRVHVGAATLEIHDFSTTPTYATLTVGVTGLPEPAARELIQFTKKSLGVEVTEQPEPIQLISGSVRPDAAASVATSTEYFVAHEFAPAQIDDLRKAIDSALSGSGLTAYYADSELRQGHIFNDKILPKIRICRFGIYEISNPGRPNVFLELGAGLALGKPCIIICKRGTEVPADLGGLDRIEYQSYVDLAGQLKDKLKPYL